jgi:hypothetical protein
MRQKSEAVNDQLDENPSTCTLIRSGEVNKSLNIPKGNQNPYIEEVS